MLNYQQGGDEFQSENTSAQQIVPPNNKKQKKEADKTTLNKNNKDKVDTKNDTAVEPAPFDYSKLQLEHLKMFNPNAPMSDNPFFEGVARSGGLAKHEENKRYSRKRR